MIYHNYPDRQDIMLPSIKWSKSWLDLMTIHVLLYMFFLYDIFIIDYFLKVWGTNTGFADSTSYENKWQCALRIKEILLLQYSPGALFINMV